MNNASSGHKRTERYLLGNLSDEEMAAFERDAMAAEESFEHVLAIEDELMYDYLRGELSPADRQRFAERYLGSPAKRPREAFGEALLDWAASHQRRAPAVDGWRLLQLVAAGLSIAALGLSMWLYRETGRIATLAGNTIQRSPEVAVPLAVSFFLEPGLNRAGTGMNHLRLPPAAAELHLRLDGSRAELGKPYRGTLQTADGVEVWSANGLVYQREGLRIILPAAIILPGEYTLVLHLPGTSGEDLDYHFAIRR